MSKAYKVEDHCEAQMERLRADATIDGRTVRGRVVAGEFVDAGDDQGRRPGTYITIRLDDPRASLVAGPVQVTYIQWMAEESGHGRKEDGR